MGLRINTNVASISSRRMLNHTKLELDNNLAKMASGQRINRAGDDAAGLAISENLKAQIRSIRQSKRNAGDAISMIQTAEGGLSEVSNILIRLRELSIQAASDSVGEVERKFTDIEFQNLKDEVERIAQSAEFNGINLLNGTGGLLEFQIGIRNNPVLDRLTYDTSLIDSTLPSLGLGQTGISSKIMAQQSLDNIDTALVRVNGMRAELGAKQNRVSSSIRSLEINDENLSAANSRIRDVDVAEETAELAKNNILLQAGISVLSQANQMPNVAVKLIGS